MESDNTDESESYSGYDLRKRCKLMKRKEETKIPFKERRKLSYESQI